MMKHATLCILAYKRPDLLKRCLKSIWATADYPYTIIVNLDGDDSGNSEYLYELYKQKKISYLILNAGENRGVGRSFENCLGLAEGDYIFKIDTDCIFKPRWLSTSVTILDEYLGVGAISLFNYRNYDPNDTRFNVIKDMVLCDIVDDFVSSAYGFRRQDLPLIQPVQDDGNHTKLGTLAVTKEDYLTNEGFGVYKSTYVSGTEEAPFKTPTHATPLIYKTGLQ